MNIYLKNLTFFMLGKALLYATPVLLLPFLAAFLTKEDLGLIATFTAFHSIFRIFIGFGTSSALARFFLDRDHNPKRFGQYFFGCLIVNFVMLVVVLLVCGVFLFVDLIVVSFEVILIAPVFSSAVLLKEYYLKILVLEKKGFQHSVLVGSAPLIGAALSVTFIMFLFNDWTGRVFAILIAEAIVSLLVAAIIVRRQLIHVEASNSQILDILKFSVPLLPHAIGIALLHSLDKLALGAVISMGEVGVYSIAVSIATLLMAALIALDHAVEPVIFSCLKNPGTHRKIYAGGAGCYLIAISCAGAALYLVASPIIRLALDQRYWEADRYIGWLILGQICFAIYRYFVKALFFSKKTYMVSIGSVLGGGLGICIYGPLITKFGSLGAAVGNSLSFFLMLVLVFMFSKTIFPFAFRDMFSGIPEAIRYLSGRHIDTRV